ncbi:MAG: hypothetical protein RSE32_08045 [Comamonas sp.]|uniref:hypothetical protein n=1 Tax=Comamonas sp. TaxID=34028 RepID=UPI002FC88C91
MKNLLDDLRDWFVIVLLLLGFFLAWGAGHYRDLAAANAKELKTLQGQVQHQADLAKLKLDEITRQRDAKQTELNDFQKTQEKKDEAATLEITRLAGELEHRPVRVRIVTQPAQCGSGGGGTQGDAAASAEAGAGNPAQAYGLLPESNSRRLGAVIAEAETVNAAYASCRAQLFKLEGVTQ